MNKTKNEKPQHEVSTQLLTHTSNTAKNDNELNDCIILLLHLQQIYKKQLTCKLITMPNSYKYTHIVHNETYIILLRQD